MVNLKDFTIEELKEFLIEMNEKPFRAKQIFAWLHKGVESFDEMTDISVSLKAKLSQVSYISSLKILRKLESKIDGTKKYLFELTDGNCVESVVMYYKHGITICISCQVVNSVHQLLAVWYVHLLREKFWIRFFLPKRT